MGGGHHMGGRGHLMNLAELDGAKPIQELAKKAAKPAKVEELATKRVTAASPGTKKVMEEISFEKPTWEDKDGMGWATFPYGAGFGEEFAGFGAPYGAGPWGYEDFGYGGFEGYGFAPEYGYGAAEPYGDF